MHQNADRAAQAAHCAADQGRFWEIHKLMMSQQDSLDDPSFFARALDLNISEFEDCLVTEVYRERVQNNVALARSLGITGVPGFIIGVIDPQKPGSVKGISSIRGAQSFSNFQKEIESARSNR
jgi:protein-disulfide isomerase